MASVREYFFAAEFVVSINGIVPSFVENPYILRLYTISAVKRFPRQNDVRAYNFQMIFTIYPQTVENIV